MDKYIGRLLDNRYEILEVIGIGGMAVVYKAKCHRLNRLVAIKILKDDYLEDEDFLSRFHAEGQAVAMLSHPNIVSVYDVSSKTGNDYIVMELIEGITLKQYMERKGTLNWKETLHFATQIAKALEHAHSRGIVHRDIKPHNIMVLKNGSVKVADFGIARGIGPGNTLTKEALGSVHYISPEQAKGEHVDARSDIYSLGVVMYEMITGKQPYEGSSPVNVALQHISGGAVMPSLLNSSIPEGFEQIVMKAMAHAPDNRYNSADELLNAMEEFRKDPTIVFAYKNTVPELRKFGRTTNPRATTAQKTGETVEPKVSVQLPEERKRDKAERPVDKKSKSAKTATIVCLVAISLAVVVLCVLLFNPFSGSKTVTVPDLVGKTYASLPKYPGITVEIGQEIYDYFYDAGKIIFQDVEKNSRVEKGTVIYVTVSKGKEAPTPVLMINVIGKTKETAERELLNLGIGLKFSYEEKESETAPAGTVISSEPSEGTELEVGQTIKLVIAKKKEILKGNVPSVIGLTKEEAINSLGRNYFGNYEVVYAKSNEPEGTVINQSIPSGTKVDVTEKITLTVSLGPPEVDSTTETTGSQNQPENPGGDNTGA